MTDVNQESIVAALRTVYINIGKEMESPYPCYTADGANRMRLYADLLIQSLNRCEFSQFTVIWREFSSIHPDSFEVMADQFLEVLGIENAVPVFAWLRDQNVES